MRIDGLVDVWILIKEINFLIVSFVELLLGVDKIKFKFLSRGSNFLL